MHQQNKVRAGRHAVALLHRVVSGDAHFKRFELFTALPVECDFNNRRQAVADDDREFVGAEQRDLALDQAGVAQSFDAAQAGGRRDARAGGQIKVAE